nr:zinc transporter 8-like [Ipomoea batatas]
MPSAEKVYADKSGSRGRNRSDRDEVVQKPELSAAAMVMVTGIICCDGDGDATATRLPAAKAMASSSLLRRQGLSAAVVPWRESNLFFIIKAFAASVISCTGFIHVLPETFDTFTNPACRKNLMVSTFDGQGRAGEGLKSIGQDVEGVDGQDHPGCKGLNDEEEAALQP